MQDIHFDWRPKLFSPSRLPGTMASADFSQFVFPASLFDSYFVDVCEISRDKSRTFPRLPVQSTYQGYDCLLDFTAACQLIRLIRLVIGRCAFSSRSFLSVGPRFRYPFFSPLLAGQTLGVAIGFVGNYAPWDFHPSFGTCPSYTCEFVRFSGQIRALSGV